MALSDLIRNAIERGRLTPELILSGLPPYRGGVKKAFEASGRGGVDPDVAEFLYLTDLMDAVAENELFGPLGFEKRSHFEGAFSDLNEIRKRVAHPTRALLESRDDIQLLWQNILVVEQALSNLRRNAPDSPDTAST